MRWAWIGLCAVAWGGGCERTPPGDPTATPEDPAATPEPAPSIAPGPVPSRAEPPRLTGLAAPGVASSTLALGRWDDRRIAVVADEDEARVVVVDLDGGEQLAAAPIGGRPGHVVIDDARIWVSVRDRSEVVALAPSCTEPACAPALEPTERIATAAEPIALGFTDDGATLLVTCGWGRVLQGHAIAPGGRDLSIALGRQPRGFAVAADGRRAWVAHAVGSRVTVVDLGERPTVSLERALHWRDDVGDGGWRLTNVPRFAVQGTTVAAVGGEVLVPMVLAYPGEPQTQSQGYGMSVDGFEPFFPHEPVLVALDETGAEAHLRLAHEVVAADRERISDQRRHAPAAQPPCLLPRASALDHASSRMLVACRDLGQVVAWSTTAGAVLLRSERGRWVVGAGVDGVAVDAEHHEAWAWSPFDRRLDRLALDDGAIQPDDTITLVATRTVPAAEGRREFHTPRAFDGRSCASCHIDGRDDGLVWQSPRGVVQTPVLAGRLEDTAPFGWHGDGVDLADHMRRTFRRMRAAPPDDATLAALEAYLRVMPTYLPEPGRWTAAQARGREVFRSPAAGCDACHADDVGTDAARHAIVRGAPIDTPSLRFVGDTAPYMHDGRYATLRETLVHTDSRMGLTSGLSEGEIADLIAYLRVL